MDRIIGAFTFRKGVYSEVEHDTSFTTTAWALVAIAGFLSQLGSRAASNLDDPIRWLFGTVISTLFVLVSFGVGVAIINFAGRTVFNAEVTFEELARTLGLAYVWNAIGVLGVLGAVSGALACVVAPAQIAGAVLGLVAWFVAAKEALDLEWVQVVVTVVIGWVIGLVIMLIAGGVLGLLGLGAAAAGGLLG
jgi:hypothetical protein